MASCVIALGVLGISSAVAASDARKPGLGSPSFQPGFYVTNLKSNRITEYSLDATGDVAPALTISGRSTGLSQPPNLRFDAAGDLFVLNGNNTITEYAPRANGHVARILTLGGPRTAINAADGFAFDKRGDIYVSNGGSGSITEYARGAHGDAAPIRTIAGPATGLMTPEGVVIDAAGDIVVASDGANDGKPWSIVKFSARARGNVAPFATLTGPDTELGVPADIEYDGRGRLWVTDAGTNAITEYASAATGDARPIRTISGPKTRLSTPIGLDIDPSTGGST